ncbi:hypothetical protein LJN55_09125 [Erwinia rhapontici]|uniref:hypothetical protein n=1 Tax=Erwinia rhapontici TaxID=55212 RepID=UPI001D0DBF01|nr:hypothetical protein [Erwinia rhapontici]UDQ81972.1 hypothetical protein LJN55_09125 [Erwinia rhapontici]
MSDTSSVILTAYATGILALIGLCQVFILISQRTQLRLDWAETYRKRWGEIRIDWGKVIYFGHAPGDYYQIATAEVISEIGRMKNGNQNTTREIWALEPSIRVFNELNDICLRIMQGHLKIGDTYPILGTEFLRQSASMRNLLDYQYSSRQRNSDNQEHVNVQRSIRTWLACHDGIRRRCLILIDMLWAEAVRLEDLPPYDIRIAANAKIYTGKDRKKRLKDEVIRLNGYVSIMRAVSLSYFLQHSEFKKNKYTRGINKVRLKELEEVWTARYLEE